MALGITLIDKEGVAHKMAGLLGVVTSTRSANFISGIAKLFCKKLLSDIKGAADCEDMNFIILMLEEPDAPLAQVTDADGNL